VRLAELEQVLQFLSDIKLLLSSLIPKLDHGNGIQMGISHDVLVGFEICPVSHRQ